MILRIFQVIATSGFLAALECTKFVFGQGFDPEPTGGSYSASPARLRDRTSKGRRGEGTGERERERGKGEERDGRDQQPLPQIPGSASVTSTKQGVDHAVHATLSVLFFY